MHQPRGNCEGSAFGFAARLESSTSLRVGYSGGFSRGAASRSFDAMHRPIDCVAPNIARASPANDVFLPSPFRGGAGGGV